MRSITTFALASIVGLVSAAPTPANAITPTRVAITPAYASAWSGVFRVQFALEGRDAAPAALVVERTTAGASAFMLVDERGLPLGKLRIDGDVLHAVLTSEHGTGELTLHITGDQVIGTYRVGKQRWDVSGQRSA